MKNLNRLAAMAATSTALAANAGQYSDLWFNPQESGWGVNVVQQLETAFVTLFVHDAAGRPTWFVASDARVVAYDAGGLPVFAGTLYRTEGAFHGGPWDPSRARLVPVGQLSLEVVARDRMRVHYTADGASVVREVVRQTWQEPVVAANYASHFVLRAAVPGGPPIGTVDYDADVLIHFDNGQGFMRVDLAGGRRCEYRGPYAQTGRIARFSGEFTCTSGDARAGTFEVTDLEVNNHGMTGYLRTWSAGFNQFGRFGAARY